MVNIIKVKGKKDITNLVISVLLSVGVGLFSSVFTLGYTERYKDLAKPAFAPPGWLFAPVWIVLYILMGLAAYRVYMVGTYRREVRSALRFFALQLVFNFFWSLIFFRFDMKGLAFIELLVLIILVFIATSKFYKLDRTAGHLMIPYLLWILFAAVLNYSIWMMNM